MSKKCSACLGYGFWCWGHIAPMGRLDAEDGTPTIECPECKASANPMKDTEHHLAIGKARVLKEIHRRGKLKFGDPPVSIQETRKEVNKIYDEMG